MSCPQCLEENKQSIITNGYGYGYIGNINDCHRHIVVKKEKDTNQNKWSDGIPYEKSNTCKTHNLKYDFDTIYTLIRYINTIYPDLHMYDSDSFFTAYKIPVDIWNANVDIPISQISTINQQLNIGSICLFNDKVILSY